MIWLAIVTWTLLALPLGVFTGRRLRGLDSK